jgi:hypothetical protein
MGVQMIRPPYPMCARIDTGHSTPLRIEVVGFDDDGSAWIVDEGDTEASLASDYGKGFVGLEESADQGSIQVAHPGWFIVTWYESDLPDGQPGAMLIPIAGWRITRGAMTPVANVDGSDNRMRDVNYDEDMAHYFGRVYGPGEIPPDAAELAAVAVTLCAANIERRKRAAEMRAERKAQLAAEAAK